MYLKVLANGVTPDSTDSHIDLFTARRRPQSRTDTKGAEITALMITDHAPPSHLRQEMLSPGHRGETIERRGIGNRL